LDRTVLLAGPNPFFKNIQQAVVDGFQASAADRVGFRHLVGEMAVEEKKRVFQLARQVQVKSDRTLHHFQAVAAIAVFFVMRKLAKDGCLDLFQNVEKEIFLVFEVVENRSPGGTGGFGQFRHGRALEALS
jgi:hypothetical protein